MVLNFPKQKVAGAKMFTFSMPELEKVIPMFHKTFVYIGKFPSCELFSVSNHLQKTVWWQIQLDSIRGNLPENVNDKLDQTNRIFFSQPVSFDNNT